MSWGWKGKWEKSLNISRKEGRKKRKNVTREGGRLDKGMNTEKKIIKGREGRKRGGSLGKGAILFAWEYAFGPHSKTYSQWKEEFFLNNSCMGWVWGLTHRNSDSEGCIWDVRLWKCKRGESLWEAKVKDGNFGGECEQLVWYN